MKYLTTYLLLKLGGKDHPSKEDITQALAAVGIDADASDIDELLARLEGKDLDEMIAQGNTMLAIFGAGSSDISNSSQDHSGVTGEEEPKNGPVDEPPEDAPDIKGGGLFGDPNDGDY